VDKVIHWFRQDLRLSDNPALTKASERGLILPIYIFDSKSLKPIGSASKLWLYHSLKSLNNSLDQKLSLYKGHPLTVLKQLINKYSIKGVYWNKCYEPQQIQQDREIKKELSGLVYESSGASLLWEPETVNKQDGTPYRVFTPFYKKGCLKATTPRKVLKKPKSLKLYKDSSHKNKWEDLKLLPSIN